MLYNILHTLISIMCANAVILPVSAVGENTFNIQIMDDLDANNQIIYDQQNDTGIAPSGTDDYRRITGKINNYSDTNINGKMIKLTAHTLNYGKYVIPIEEDLQTNTDNKVKIWSNELGNYYEDALPTEEMYLIKVNVVGNTTGTSITMTDWMYDELDYWIKTKDDTTYTIQDNKLKYVVKTTISKDSDSYERFFGYNNLNDMWNNEFQQLSYPLSLNIQYDQIYSGNATDIQRESLQTMYHDQNESSYIANYTEDIDFYPNGITYIIIYVQPRIVENPNNQMIGYGLKLKHTTGQPIHPYYFINDWMQSTITGNMVYTPNQEIIDVPGVMFYVLGMPFTFVSTAFNLTIFPGTPYQVNLSMIFLTILGVLIFMFLIKIVIKAFR